MSALDTTNRAFIAALAEAGYAPPDLAPPAFRCGHPKEGENLQRMGGVPVCRICRTKSRIEHRERFRRKYMPEAIRRARARVARLEAEARELGIDVEALPC